MPVLSRAALGAASCALLATSGCSSTPDEPPTGTPAAETSRTAAVREAPFDDGPSVCVESGRVETLVVHGITAPPTRAVTIDSVDLVNGSAITLVEAAVRPIDSAPSMTWTTSQPFSQARRTKQWDSRLEASGAHISTDQSIAFMLRFAPAPSRDGSVEDVVVHYTAGDQQYDLRLGTRLLFGGTCPRP